MPGHPVGESILEQTQESVDKLILLINEHDVIFLLMDSRESRWLPTLLGSFMQKVKKPSNLSTKKLQQSFIISGLF